MAEAEPSLATTLLHRPQGREPTTVDGGAWAYGRLAAGLVSLFAGYHLLAVLLHITPSGGLARPAKETLAWATKAPTYLRATANSQTWSMFAPNPHRRNIFVRVLVEDREGRTWDLGHDMYGRRPYPYVVYDRMAKINRRLPERQAYLGPYAAWVCREWEREHGGEPARSVRLVKLWTQIPRPATAFAPPQHIRQPWSSIGYDPLRLRLHREPLREFECALLREAQLSPQKRAELGFAPAPEGHYRPTRMETWASQARDDDADADEAVKPAEARGGPRSITPRQPSDDDDDDDRDDEEGG